MATETTRYNLKKPDYNDTANIQDINSNMDIIDEELGKQAKQINDCLGSIGDKAGLLTPIKTNLVAAINSLLSLASTTVNGLMSKEDKAKLNGIATGANLYMHPGSGTNPHGTTKTDVGLGNVANYLVANAAEAGAGMSDTVYMTPLKTKVYLDAKGLGSTSLEYSSRNLNTLVGNIGVKGANMVNAPDADWWYVEQKVHEQSSWQYQLATGLTTRRKKERWLLSGAWSTWEDTGGDGMIYMPTNTIKHQTIQTVENTSRDTIAKYFSWIPKRDGMIKIKVTGYINSVVDSGWAISVLNIKYANAQFAIASIRDKDFYTLYTAPIGTIFRNVSSEDTGLGINTGYTAGICNYDVEGMLMVTKNMPIVFCVPPTANPNPNLSAITSLKICYDEVEV